MLPDIILRLPAVNAAICVGGGDINAAERDIDYRQQRMVLRAARLQFHCTAQRRLGRIGLALRNLEFGERENPCVPSGSSAGAPAREFLNRPARRRRFALQPGKDRIDPRPAARPAVAAPRRLLPSLLVSRRLSVGRRRIDDAGADSPSKNSPNKKRRQRGGR